MVWVFAFAIISMVVAQMDTNAMWCELPQMGYYTLSIFDGEQNHFLGIEQHNKVSLLQQPSGQMWRLEQPFQLKRNWYLVRYAYNGGFKQSQDPSFNGYLMVHENNTMIVSHSDAAIVSITCTTKPNQYQFEILHDTQSYGYLNYDSKSILSKKPAKNPWDLALFTSTAL